jgi:Yip1-like protein
VPEAQAPINHFGRIIGMFFSPKSTFEDIVRKPSWLLPVGIATLLSLFVCIGINQRINWRDFMSQQIEKSSRASQLSPEQKQQQIDAGAKYAPYGTYIFGIPAPLVFVLLVALVMMGAYNLLVGADVNYGVSLGIVSHTFVPSIISSLLFLLILYLKAPGTVDLENPVATNVGAFLPEESAKWLVKLCMSIDIFSIWVLVLIAMGFAAANSRKLKGGKSYTIAFSVFAVFVVSVWGGPSSSPDTLWK